MNWCITRSTRPVSKHRKKLLNTLKFFTIDKEGIRVWEISLHQPLLGNIGNKGGKYFYESLVSIIAAHFTRK